MMDTIVNKYVLSNTFALQLGMMLPGRNPHNHDLPIQALPTHYTCGSPCAYMLTLYLFNTTPLPKYKVQTSMANLARPGRRTVLQSMELTMLQKSEMS